MNHDVEITVGGIPAIARVTYYAPASGGVGMSGPVDSYQDLAAPEAEEVEFTLCDRRGREAPWLERVASRTDAWADIERQVLAASW